MPITFPPAAEGVTYKVPSTGVTYVYNSSANCWEPAASQLTETLEDVSQDLADLEAQLDALESTPVDVQLSTAKNTNRVNILVNGDADKGTFIEPVTDFLAGLMVPDDRRHLYTWDADNYYSKDQIDNQFTLRGVGYTYLLSSISGSVTIRPGEMHTNNRLVGQITFISMGEIDENGKQRRSPVEGDLIELYDTTTEKFYRYLINTAGETSYSVVYQGSEADQNDALGIGNPFLVYLYPAHISASNYYDKGTSDERFLSQKPGANQVCQRSIDFQAPIDYTGLVQSSTNVANKRYVDEQVASRAIISYGDYPPTGNIEDGNLWFDSMNLRLSVYSQGAWINPDRDVAGNLVNRLTDLEDRVDLLEDN